MKAHLDERLARLKYLKDTEPEPSINHEEKFLNKLKSRAKKVIDLTPYFIKLALGAVLVYIIAVIIWYSVSNVEQMTIMDLIHKLR